MNRTAYSDIPVMGVDNSTPVASIRDCNLHISHLVYASIDIRELKKKQCCSSAKNMTFQRMFVYLFSLIFRFILSIIKNCYLGEIVMKKDK